MQARRLLLVASTWSTTLATLVMAHSTQQSPIKEALVEISPKHLREAWKGTLSEDELLCKTYKNGRAKLRLCEVEMQDFIQENKRVAKTHLFLTNIGDVGVCNLSMFMEGMDTDKVVDVWPEWIDLKSNEGYLAPDENLDLGGNVEMPSGWPDYYMVDGFHECLAPDYVESPYKACHTYKDGDVNLEWCVEKKLDSWMENDGTRTMALQGVVYNNGTVPVCGLKIDMDRAEDASETWPDWFPTLTLKNAAQPLGEGDSVIVGGKVPAKGGRPNIKLSAFKACPSDYEERSAAFHSDEGAELSEEDEGQDQDKEEGDKGTVDDEPLLSELDDNDKAAASTLLPPRNERSDNRLRR